MAVSQCSVEFEKLIVFTENSKVNESDSYVSLNHRVL